MRELSNNKVVYFINKLVDMVILSLLWVLCSLPVFTVGASSAALYHAVTETIIHDKGYAYKDFFRNFKSSFRQSIFFTLVTLLFLAAFGFIIYFCYHNPMGFFTRLYSVFALFCLALTMLAEIYSFAMIGRFQLTTQQILSLLVKMIFKNLPHSLLLIVVFAVVLDFTIMYPFLLLITPSAFSFLVSAVTEPAFKRFIRYDDGNTIEEEPTDA